MFQVRADFVLALAGSSVALALLERGVIGRTRRFGPGRFAVISLASFQLCLAVSVFFDVMWPRVTGGLLIVLVVLLATSLSVVAVAAWREGRTGDSLR